MTHQTITRALVGALRDLRKDDFLTFCHQLRDRREEPRVRRRAVEDKSCWEIADLMVSTFTERKVLQVTLDILRQVNCNEEADGLYSKTKACLDNGNPTFPKNSKGELETKASQEALKYKAVQRPFKSAQSAGPPVKTSQEVEADAKARVLSEGGDPNDKSVVLSRCTIQFGKYRDQTFQWLLENDVGYTAFVVAAHQKEREHSTEQNQLMANKESLTQYVTAYPEVMREVRFHRGYERSLQSGQSGEALVGFGLHRLETLKSLYESKDPQKISYVNFLRGMKSTCDPGSRMDDAVKYILQRDKEQTKRPNRRKWVQHFKVSPPLPQGPYGGGRKGANRLSHD